MPPPPDLPSDSDNEKRQGDNDGDNKYTGDDRGGVVEGANTDEQGQNGDHSGQKELTATEKALQERQGQVTISDINRINEPNGDQNNPVGRRIEISGSVVEAPIDELEDTIGDATKGYQGFIADPVKRQQLIAEHKKVIEELNTPIKSAQRALQRAKSSVDYNAIEEAKKRVAALQAKKQKRKDLIASLERLNAKALNLKINGEEDGNNGHHN